VWTKTFTVLRDVLCLVVGGYLLIREGQKPMPSAVLLVIYMVIVTSPGTFAAKWLGGSNTDTAGSSSPQPSSSPSSESSSPS
jgi:hypothetical protein